MKRRPIGFFTKKTKSGKKVRVPITPRQPFRQRLNYTPSVTLETQRVSRDIRGDEDLEDIHKETIQTLKSEKRVYRGLLSVDAVDNALRNMEIVGGKSFRKQSRMVSFSIDPETSANFGNIVIEVDLTKASGQMSTYPDWDLGPGLEAGEVTAPRGLRLLSEDAIKSISVIGDSAYGSNFPEAALKDYETLKAKYGDKVRYYKDIRDFIIDT